MSRILFLLLLCWSVAVATTEAAPLPDEVARLIRQLGDDDFQRREAASKRLDEIGLPAWSALRRTMNTPGDAEVRARCARLLEEGTRRSFTPLPDIKGQGTAITSLALSGDGKVLVTGCSDRLALWNVEKGQMGDFSPGIFAGNQTVALSHDGKRCLAIGSPYLVEGKGLVKKRDITIRVCDDKLAEVRRLVGHTDEARCIVFLPDGKRALSAGQDRTIRLWDVDTGKEIRKFVGHTGAIRSLAVSSDGKQALSSSQDGTARCWNVDTGEELSRFTGHQADVCGVAFVPDGKHAVSVGADKMARLWLTATGQEVRRFEGHTRSLCGVAVSPDGRWLLTSGGMMARPPSGYVPAPDDHDIRLWDLASGVELYRFAGNASAVPVVLFAPDGKSILAGGSDNIIRRWQFAVPPAR